MLLKVRLILIFLFISLTLSAQRYNFTNFNIANGLPGNQINKILQDHNGRLWIGTMNGTCFYDGKTFNLFNSNEIVSNNPVKTIFEDRNGIIWLGTVRKGVCRYYGTGFKFYTTSDGLLSDIVNAICDDDSGRIWMGTSEGLSCYHNRTFTNYTTLKGLVNNTVLDLHVDKQGLLWIATTGGLSVYDGHRFKNYTVKDGLTSNVIYCIREASNGKIWLGTYQGVSVFENGKFTNYSAVDGLPNERIEAITEDENGNMWFATNGGGLARFDGTHFRPVNIGQGINSNIVKSLMIDREGNFWLGTWNGIFRYNADRFVSYTIDDGLSSNSILCVYADALNRIWMGTLAGGINIYNGSSFTQLQVPDNLTNSTIWCIYQDRQGYYWMGTTNGPYRYNEQLNMAEAVFPELNNQIIYSILNDQKGNYWFGTDRGIYKFNGTTLEVINKKNGLAEEKVRVLFEDKAGTIWAGTLKGVYTLNNNSAISFNAKHKLPDAPVTSINSDRNNSIIISTYNFGIIVYNKTRSGEELKVIDKENGLNDERILFSYIDSKNILWMGTPDGIDFIEWNNYKSGNKVSTTHFDKTNGFLGVETNAVCEDTSGYLWFATVNGAIRFNPSAGSVKPTLPSVFISKIQLFYEDVDWRKNQIRINRLTNLPENLILAYNNNHLTFLFSGIFLTAPEEVSYRFMLEGFDDTWSPVTKLSFANYSNLQAGEYTFKVQASANNRDWSVPVTYSFEIKPPFWKTPFFYLLYIVTGVGSIWLIYNYRTSALRRRSQLLQQKVDIRTRELQEKNLELAKLSLVASETDNAVMIFDQKLELEWVNTGFTKLTGYTLNEVKKVRGVNLSDLTSNTVVVDHLDECIAEKRSFIYESELMNKSGKRLWASSTLTPIISEEGQLTNVVVIDTDITLRKNMEEQIRESLEERGVLLREIHHRVKNNLQIIISLFNLQTHYVQDANASKALREGQNRIKSMALIHERFYQSDGLSKIDFDDYIRRLTENLLQTSGISSGQIGLNIISEKISLDIDTAVPCGLIINEVVSNSIKHAFNDGRRGEILIQFNKIEDHTYKLVIADNGTGLPENFRLEESDSLGISLIHALTDQIDGTLKIENQNGVKYIITFKTIHK